MRWLPPTFLISLCLPHVEGDVRWVMLGVFVGLLCLMLREIA